MRRIFHARFQCLSCFSRVMASRVGEGLKVYETGDTIFRGEAAGELFAMLKHATPEVAGNADIKRATDAAGKDVDVAGALGHPSSVRAARGRVKR